MKIIHIMALLGLFMALETAIPAWRLKAPASTAPVSPLPMADKAINAPKANPGAPSTSITPTTEENPAAPEPTATRPGR